jgi:predicted RNase H-like HicB family nuclease
LNRIRHHPSTSSIPPQKWEIHPHLRICTGETFRDVPNEVGLKVNGSQAGLTMRYVVILEKGQTSFGAYAPDLPGCIAVGETQEEVLQLMQEAIEMHLEDLKEEDYE